jgi:SAM-dependent methyltransferase
MEASTDPRGAGRRRTGPRDARRAPGRADARRRLRARVLLRGACRGRAGSVWASTKRGDDRLGDAALRGARQRRAARCRTRRRWPFADADFDARCVGARCFEYVADTSAGLAELHRALQPGGGCSCGTRTGRRASMQDDELTRRVHRAWDEHLTHTLAAADAGAVAAGGGVRERAGARPPAGHGRVRPGDLRRRAGAVHRAYVAGHARRRCQVEAAAWSRRSGRCEQRASTTSRSRSSASQR